jgi:hypothetical protein
MEKKLINLSLFVSGEPYNDFPDRVYMTYGVKVGQAKKDNLVYEVDDPDPNKTVSEIWEETIENIKRIEKI